MKTKTNYTFTNSSEESIMLTPEEIRSHPGLENLTDDEVQNIARSLLELASIAYEVYESQNSTEELKKL